MLLFLKTRSIKGVGCVGRVGEGKVLYWVLVGNPGLENSLGKRSRKCEDNIQMELQAVGCV